MLNNKQCHFCSQNTGYIDYKDINTLRHFVSLQAKIYKPKKTGICASHQRKLSEAIKRARVMALLPYTNLHTK
ncbi:MAG: 30S ribosomal protein S18 [Patescibacteria group bacterium]|nr:30S ribosomal protein S18 [Patescibacteria group bacterium]MDE2438016.1 30S ribosomal protein S18 [Patescibacteria group bacterium]